MGISLPMVPHISSCAPDPPNPRLTQSYSRFDSAPRVIGCFFPVATCDLVARHRAAPHHAIANRPEPVKPQRSQEVEVCAAR